MFSRVFIFYAVGFFLTIFSVITMITLGLDKIKPLSSLLFFLLLALTFSFPTAVVILLSIKLKSAKVRSITPAKFLVQLGREKISIIFILLLGLISVASISSLYYFSSRITTTNLTVSNILITPSATPTPTAFASKSESSDGLYFHKPFHLEGSLVFAKILDSDSPYFRKQRLELLIWDGSKKHFFAYNFDINSKTWKKIFLYNSAREFLSLEGKAVSFQYKGDSLKYQPKDDSIHSRIEDRSKSGYIENCYQKDQDREICFSYRSVYFSPFKNRLYPWDGRFFYRSFEDQKTEEILSYDYSDLKIIWNDPKNYCHEDCFSTGLLGFFDDYSKALLVLKGKSTSNWGGEDGSNWFGFYLADLEQMKLTPYQSSDFGKYKRSQFSSYLVFPEMNLFVYFNDENQLIAENLLSRKRFVLKKYPENLKKKAETVDMERIGEGYLLARGNWALAGKFEEYFDLTQFNQLSTSETPLYVKNWQGFWNYQKTQYAWEKEGEVFVYDISQKKKGVVLSHRNVENLDSFHLVGWGFN